MSRAAASFGGASVRISLAILAAAWSLGSPKTVHAQAMPMPMDHVAAPPASAPATMPDMPGMPAPAKPATDMAGMDMGSGPMMAGDLGAYAMTRDASGTSWQPDSTPMEGVMGALGGWSTMLHGYAFGVYDNQGGPRGGDKAFSESMLMAMAQRPVGVGTLTLRTMLSLDPLMGPDGYPLLLQTGETANGKTPLVDRQHPHDLFMELSATYSVPVGKDASTFLYVGYPGEPALGPVTFMHRFSGMDDPEAPIGHHWLDSTHITYGVVTAGFVQGSWKLEGSVFTGREPDQFRWNFDPIRLDSWSARLSWNPGPNWALQASYGFIKSPEQLEPDQDQRRITASATYNRPLSHGNWQTTFAWGQNQDAPGPILNAYLLESTIRWDRHTLFSRAENDQKNELFGLGSPLAGRVFDVSTLSIGYIYDVPIAKHLSLGLGALGSVYGLPSAITPFYGSQPASYMTFLRLALR
jgi:hypothetical protein